MARFVFPTWPPGRRAGDRPAPTGAEAQWKRGLALAVLVATVVAGGVALALLVL